MHTEIVTNEKLTIELIQTIGKKKKKKKR